MCILNTRAHFALQDNAKNLLTSISGKMFSMRVSYICNKYSPFLLGGTAESDLTQEGNHVCIILF